MRVHRLIQVGAGGIGQFFAPVAEKILRYLNEGEPLFSVFDGDTYEESNGNRQRGEEGINKASFLNLNLGVDCMVHPHYIEDEDHVARIMVTGRGSEDPTVIAVCVDNDATRHFIYKGVESTKVPCIVIDMANELHTGDVICHCWDGDKWVPSTPWESYPQLVEPGDRPPQAYCTEAAPSHPQIITTNMQAACIGARMLYNLLSDEGANLQVTFDHSAFDMRQPDA